MKTISYIRCSIFIRQFLSDPVKSTNLMSKYKLNQSQLTKQTVNTVAPDSSFKQESVNEELKLIQQLRKKRAT